MSGDDYAGRHRRWGWSLLPLFVAFGLVLEMLHGFKVDAYLNLTNETRRLLWTLAHAHGSALAIINIVFGLALDREPLKTMANLGPTSACLLAATVFLPLGFLLGGVTSSEGDPGLGILLVPPGAVLLVAALLLVAHAARRR